MAAQVRSECKQCGVHTFRSMCGNCGSTELRTVVVSSGDEAKRFARQTVRDLTGAFGGRGLRSSGAL